MTKVYAPDRSFSGPGAGGAVFKDGVADVTSEPALAYFRSAGYGIGQPATPPSPAAGLADARDYAQPIQLGTPLRDAAVDPHPTDFLAPTNAGEADPHGPLVVSPGLHAVPPAPIAPGPVPADTKAQDDKETAIAQAVLVEGKPATVIADPFASPVDDVRVADQPPDATAKKPARKSSTRKSARRSASSAPKQADAERAAATSSPRNRPPDVVAEARSAPPDKG